MNIEKYKWNVPDTKETIDIFNEIENDTLLPTSLKRILSSIIQNPITLVYEDIHKWNNLIGDETTRQYELVQQMKKQSDYYEKKIIELLNKNIIK